MSKDVMAKNDSGELIRIDHSNTYEGTATMPDGHVVKNKFRCNSRQDAIEQWRAWQTSSISKNRDRQRNLAAKSLNQENKLNEFLAVFARIADALELIALSNDVTDTAASVKEEEQPAKDAESGLLEFLSKHDAHEFINCTSKQIYEMVKEYCVKENYETPAQNLVTRKVKEKCADVLTWKSDHSGTTFLYKGV